MEKKIEGLEKHVKFLYEELEDKEKEIVDLKESVDHANEICRKKNFNLKKKKSLRLEKTGEINVTR